MALAQGSKSEELNTCKHIAACKKGLRLMHPQILVVGGSRVGKKALAARLLGRPAAQLAQQELWLIDTKYYTAQASVVLKSANAEGVERQVLACTQCCVPHRQKA